MPPKRTEGIEVPELDLATLYSLGVRDMTVSAAAMVKEDESDRSLTCMICGKTFPRGGVDLERHCSAKTLMHYVATKKMPYFTIMCSCKLCFANEAQMMLHRQNICVDTGPHDKILPIPVAVTKEMKEKKARAKIESYSKEKKQASSNSNLSLNADALAEGSAAIVAAQAEGSQSISSSAQGQGAKRKMEDSGEQYQSVGKRMKVIIPEDRKAFFAVASLLVDPQMMPKNTEITTDNFEDFIPARHHTLMQRLKEKLNWSA